MTGIQRYDQVFRIDEETGCEGYVEVKDIEGPFVHYSDYQKLERKVKRLEKRLTEKKKFETMDLIQKGATAEFRAKIDKKDSEALKED
jgi:hypothetical protein